MSQQTSIAHIDHSLDQSASSPRLEGIWLQTAQAGWVILALIALGILLTSLPGYAMQFGGQLRHAGADTPSTSVKFFSVASGLTSLGAALLSLALSWVLFRRRFAEPAAAALSFYLLLYGIVMAGPMEGWMLYWLGTIEYAPFIQAILLGTPTVALFALFPNGRFFPSWMQWVLLATVPWSLVQLFLPSFTTATISSQSVLFIIVAAGFVFMYVSSIYAQVYRYRFASTRIERQQTKWVVYGFTLWIAYILLSSGPYFYLTSLPPGASVPWWAPASELGWFLGLTIVPVSFTISITRYQLWNIDLVINRTLVYSALTASIIVVYVLIVGGFGYLFQSRDNLLLSLLAAGAAAVLFQPLRGRLQSAVNKMMFGDRDDPAAVLLKLGEQLEKTGSPGDALLGIVKTVAQTLKLPYVAIELGEESEIAATYGPPVSTTLPFPLIYQGETVGMMVVAERSPGEAFNPKDRQLLENIARQAGAAAQAVKLTADLRHSRQKLITTREEERRRLRRDLHDGLGPTLASQTLKLDAARNLLSENPAKAEQLLNDLKKQTQGTLHDIRNLVYDLRPPALDELGLIGAIQSFIEGKASLRPQITLEVPEPLPPLPAAFEVAIYRITLEGVTNVLRHADANTATIRISLIDDGITIDIIDDGIGLSKSPPAGVGLASMQERAEELEGSFNLIPKGQGLHIRARLPLPEE